MKKYLLLFVFVTCLFQAKAQTSMFSLDWGIGVPVGDLEEYTDEVSVRGFNIGGRVFLLDFVSVGGYAGWQLFYKSMYGQDKINETVDFFGKQVRHMSVYPIMGNVFYYLGQDGGIRPYIGSNIGLSIINQKTQYGIWEISQTSTHFSIAPEAGVFVPVGLAGGGIKLSGRYDHSFKTNKLDMHVQSFVFTIGFTMAY